jgi:hypothetical protein
MKMGLVPKNWKRQNLRYDLVEIENLEKIMSYMYGMLHGEK